MSAQIQKSMNVINRLSTVHPFVGIRLVLDIGTKCSLLHRMDWSLTWSGDSMVLSVLIYTVGSHADVLLYLSNLTSANFSNVFFTLLWTLCLYLYLSPQSCHFHKTIVQIYRNTVLRYMDADQLPANFMTFIVCMKKIVTVCKCCFYKKFYLIIMIYPRNYNCFALIKSSLNKVYCKYMYIVVVFCN